MNRRENTERRDDSLRKRYKVLYVEERKRIDDCIQSLMQEFFLAERTVWNILRKGA